MKVQIWSDVVCPWCYIGKHRFEAAVEQLDEDVEIEWRSFQLDPSAPLRSEERTDARLAKKYGMSAAQVDAMMDRATDEASAAGLTVNLRGTVFVNTFDAHRLLQYAQSQGLGDAMKERLFRAHFTENLPLVGIEQLSELAVDVGCSLDQVAAVLASDAYADVVRGDVAEARAIGVTGVPFFLFEGRYGVPGAQPTETMVQVLQQVRTRLSTDVEPDTGAQ